MLLPSAFLFKLALRSRLPHMKMQKTNCRRRFPPTTTEFAKQKRQSISGLVVEYIVAIDVTRVRFPADAFAEPRREHWPEKLAARRGEDVRGKRGGV